MANRVSQLPIEVLITGTVQRARVSQFPVEVLISSPNVLVDKGSPTVKAPLSRKPYLTTVQSKTVVPQKIESRQIWNTPSVPFIQSKGPNPPRIESIGPLHGTDTAGNPVSVKNCLWPVVALLDSGHPGVLFQARDPSYPIWTARNYFVRHISSWQVAPEINLFPYAAKALGLVNWYGKLLATSHDAAGVGVPGLIKCRTSPDGIQWSPEQTLIPGFSVTVDVAVGSGFVGYWLATSYDKKTLYVFYYQAGTNVVAYRYTTSQDPTTGWSGELLTGLTTQRPGWNQGNDTGEGAAYRGFVIEQMSNGGWVATCNMPEGVTNDGKDVLTTPALGGAWTVVLRFGLGGTLSGLAGAVGGVFRDRFDNLIAYAMDDPVQFFGTSTAPYDGSAWTPVVTNEVPSSPVLSFGQGKGLWVPKYGAEMIWGHARSNYSIRNLFIGGTVAVTELFGGV